MEDKLTFKKLLVSTLFGLRLWLGSDMEIDVM